MKVMSLMVLLAGLSLPLSVTAEHQPMTNDRLDTILKRLGSEVIGLPGQWRLVIGGRAVMILTDPDHDRMRIMGHVTAAEALDAELIERLMQANFDTALDARYAIARNTLWSVFLHPLGSLTEHDFLTGLGQVVNLANTFGKSYSSGLLMFRGGDSQSLNEQDLIRELLEKGLSI